VNFEGQRVFRVNVSTCPRVHRDGPKFQILSPPSSSAAAPRQGGFNARNIAPGASAHLATYIHRLERHVLSVRHFRGNVRWELQRCRLPAERPRTVRTSLARYTRPPPGQPGHPGRSCGSGNLLPLVTRPHLLPACGRAEHLHLQPGRRTPRENTCPTSSEGRQT